MGLAIGDDNNLPVGRFVTGSYLRGDFARQRHSGVNNFAKAGCM
jgi:hypothetical protein